jgi:branched-chain amino acid transport system ATP-binding protein
MTAALLECRGLTMRFGGVLALDGLDLSVNAGEVLGLIGPNGSGKTTFFNVVSGIYRLNAGTINLQDSDITHSTPGSISAQGLARTFQRSRLNLSLTVFDNVVLGAYRQVHSGLWHNIVRRRAFHEEARRVAREARDLLAVFNLGLADRLFDTADSLGMIDRRRVEICRALIGHPKLVLLDEPSAGMTIDETDAVMDEILGIRKDFGDLSVVIVEHEMGLIQRVTDRCVVLNYGKKIAEGPYRDVSQDPVVRTAYLGHA